MEASGGVVALGPLLEGLVLGFRVLGLGFWVFVCVFFFFFVWVWGSGFRDAPVTAQGSRGQQMLLPRPEEARRALLGTMQNATTT